VTVDTATAAELPEGSVVATDRKAWIKVYPGSDAPWRSTSNLGVGVNNERVQHELDTGRGTVLRVGTGQEGG
jgi:hypothetical protein